METIKTVADLYRELVDLIKGKTTVEIGDSSIGEINGIDVILITPVLPLILSEGNYIRIKDYEKFEESYKILEKYETYFTIPLPDHITESDVEGLIGKNITIANIFYDNMLKPFDEKDYPLLIISPGRREVVNNAKDDFLPSETNFAVMCIFPVPADEETGEYADSLIEIYEEAEINFADIMRIIRKNEAYIFREDIIESQPVLIIAAKIKYEGE